MVKLIYKPLSLILAVLGYFLYENLVIKLVYLLEFPFFSSNFEFKVGAYIIAQAHFIHRGVSL